MFALIPHKDKDQSNVFEKFGTPTDSVMYPAQVLVKTISGYKVLDLYVRNSNGYVFARNGSFLIALLSNGVTSNSKITWVELSGVDEFYDKCNLSYFKPDTIK